MDRQKPSVSKNEILALFEKVGLAEDLVLKAVNQVEFTYRFRSRDDGKSYLMQHIYPMVVDVYNYFKDTSDLKTAVIVTILHDLPEDDPTYKEDRLISDYGEEIARLVMFLQKPRKNKQVRYQIDKHEEHIAFVAQIESAPRMCKVIKLFDRLNNSMCTDASRNVEKYERFLHDTADLYLPLAKAVDVNLAKQMEKEIIRLDQELHT